MSIYCIGVEGGPLNDAIRNLLFDTAQEMMDKGDTIRNFRTSTGEGEVMTDNEQACIGGFTGTIFHADLDTERGSFKVKYVIRPTRDLRSIDIEWSTST